MKNFIQTVEKLHNPNFSQIEKYLFHVSFFVVNKFE